MKDRERRAIAEGVQAVLRHDARNKVGAIRNAAVYLRRKTEKSELWAEPRISEFFTLIEDQLKELEGVLGEGAREPLQPKVTSVSACVRAALEDHPLSE